MLNLLVLLMCFGCAAEDPAKQSAPALTALHDAPAPVSVTDFGAMPDDERDDTEAINRAVNAAPKGATLVFPRGTYQLRQTIFFASGRIYRGEPGACLRFNLPAENYGIALEPNAKDMTIEGLSLIGGGIRLSDGIKYENIRIVNNDISACAKGTRGVYAPIASAGLVVEGNTFRDFDEWGAMIYHMDKGSLSGNRFLNITQGAQIVNPYESVRIRGNCGHGLHRMGVEIQQFSEKEPPCRDLVVEGNIFTDWRRPFFDSFGLSVMPQNGFDVAIRNNYIVGTHSGPWGPPDGSRVNRFGYGIEAGFRTGVVENNIVAGNWANHVVVSMPKTLVRNNRFFGKPLWRRYVDGEPGMQGKGSAIERNNVVEPDLRKVPPTPEHACSEPAAAAK